MKKRPLDKFDWLLIVAAVAVVLLDSYRDRIPIPDLLPDEQPPIQVDSLHVLAVYQDTDSNDLTSDQKAILFGADTREFLDSACGEDGWRILDVDSDLTHAEQVWKEAMAVPRESTPWLVIANKDTGFSGPLTMPPGEFKSLVGEHK